MSRTQKIGFIATGVTLATIALGFEVNQAHSDPGPQSATTPSSISPPPRTHWMKTPCPFDEFVSNCVWNAKAQGNHQGYSFYSKHTRLLDVHGVQVGRVACVYYLHSEGAKPRWTACHILPKSR